MSRFSGLGFDGKKRIELKASHFWHREFGRMRQWSMSHVVKQGCEPDQRTKSREAFLLWRERGLWSLKDVLKGQGGRMHGSQAVDVAIMGGAREGIFSKTELLDLPEALEIPR